MSDEAKEAARPLRPLSLSFGETRIHIRKLLDARDTHRRNIIYGIIKLHIFQEKRCASLVEFKNANTKVEGNPS